MKRLALVCLAPLAVYVNAAATERLTFEQVLQRALDTYPALRIAELQLERARQENARVESQLGWNLGAQAGASRDVSIIFTPTDRTDVSANVSRKLSSGASIDIGAGLTREETTETFTPLIPNPSTTGAVDLSYRQPLARGAGNPSYNQGLVTAEAQVRIADADRRAAHDRLARQTADLFYAAGTTAARINNAERAIDRARRLKRFIQYNARLGLAERKDLLRIEAELRTRVAERRGLLVLWRQQRTSLNRLMGRPWDTELEPLIGDIFPPVTEDFSALLAEAERHSPDLLRNRAQVRATEAAIARSRDAQRDNVDLVLSLGNRTRSGDVLGDTIGDSEIVGALRLEYNRSLDRRGVDAEVRQALLDRDIALQDIKVVRHDLSYGLSGLLTEIDAGRTALRSYRARLAAERAKLADAEKRYRQGRIDTDRLIDFEGDLYAAELSLEQQLVELARRYTDLELLRGTLWRAITPRAPLVPMHEGRDHGERAGSDGAGEVVAR